MLKPTIELHRQGNLDAAEAGYRAFLNQHPNDSEALRLLGAVRFQKGDRDGAIELIERARAAAPEQPAPLLTLGKVHFESRDLERARDTYTRALSLDPNQADAHSALGQIALMQANAPLAEQHFRTALRAGDDAPAMAGLAMLAADVGNADIALKYATQAVQLQPQDALIQYSLGRALHLNGNRAFAEQAYTNALALRPEFGQAEYALAMLLAEDARPVEAEQMFRRVRERPGLAAAGDVGIADCLRVMGRHAEAIPLYESALDQAPQWEKAADALLFCYGQCDRIDEALVLLNRQVAAGGEAEGRWRNRRILVTTHLNLLNEAVVDNQWLHAAEPDELQYRENLGYLLDQLGEYAAAEPHVTAVLAAQPGNVEMSLIRIREALRNGDDALAADRLDGLAQQALSEGQRRLADNYRGRIADRCGEYQAAVDHFAAAQRGSPSLRHALAEIPESLDHWLDVPAGPAWQGAPVLLIGTPGSGVERLAALLADQPQLAVPRDRIGGRDRRDLFGMPPFDRADGDISADEIEQARETYAAISAAAGVEPGRLQVDWLPRWDARFLPLLHRIMPGTRIIVADRDGRAALLDWLAFGWLPTVTVDDVGRASDWLAKARRHVVHGVERSGPEHLVVDADAIVADPDGAGQALAKFLGIESLVAGPQLAALQRGQRGLPRQFAPDHWRHYGVVLADAFDRLKS